MTSSEFVQLSDRLAAAGRPVRVLDVHPLAGGASREMLLITAADDAGGDHRFVLRRDPPTQMNEQALSRQQEFTLLQAAVAAGIRAPRPVFTHPGDADTAPFFVMEYVDGIALGRKVVTAPELAAARAALPGHMAEQLARIHALDPAALAWLPRPADDLSPAADAIAQCYRVLDALGVHNPALEYGLRWAWRNAPPTTELRVCHGDFRIGNLMVNADGLAAVMDWEFAHLGDPHEELGYLCLRDWRFGGAGRVGGIAPLEPFLQAYEQHGGITVDRRAVAYWEILGNLRWGVISLAQAARHLSGSERNVELASLGRRSVEMQAEALLLIDAAQTAAQPEPAAGDLPLPGLILDRPTLAELLAAVRGHLESAVIPALKASGDARLSFQTLVAANLLAIAEREIGAVWTARLADPHATAALCGQIRAGALDDQPGLRAALLGSTAEALAIANPRLLAALLAERGALT